MTVARAWVSASLWNAVSRGLLVSTAFLFNLLLARLLTPADLGVFFLLLSIVTTATLVGQLGMRTTVVRSLARAIAQDNHHQARLAVYSSLGAFTLGTAVGALCVGAGVTLFGNPSWSSSHSAGLFGALCGCWVIFFGIQYFVPEIFRGAGDQRAAALFGGLISSLAATLVLGCMLVLGTAPASLFDVTLVMLAALGINAVLVGKRFRALARAYPPIYPGSDLGQTLAQGAPTLLGNVAVMLLFQVDLWTLAALGTSEAVAYYGVASRLAVLLGIPAQIAVATVAARLAACGDDRAAMQRVAKTAASITTVPSLVLFAIYALAGGWLLEQLFGSAYREAIGPLIALGFGHLAISVFGIAQTTLVMAGRLRAVALASLGVVLVDVVACLLLGYAFGAMGVAIASAASLALLAFLFWLIAKRLLGVDTLASPGSLWNAVQSMRSSRGR